MKLKIDILVKPGSRLNYRKYVKMHYFAPPQTYPGYGPGDIPVYAPPAIYPLGDNYG